MRKSPSSAFTLIEVITAMAVILILTGLVIQISPFVFGKGSRVRAQAVIATLETACESYKADSGAYPEDLSAEASTNKLKPQRDFKPTSGEYELASRFLYKELTGDKLGATGGPDGIRDKDEPRYLREVDARILKATRDANNKILEVKCIQDPFGYPYGYSTAAAHARRLNASAPLPIEMDGFNSSSFDLWSTGGSKPAFDPTEDKTKELEWAKWIKNW